MSWPTGTKRDKAVQVASNVDTLMSYTKAILSASVHIGNCRPINGRTYWVDADCGSNSNDGLTHDTAFETLAAAVTASEAYRILTTNVHVRNRIMLVGGVTPIPHVHALAQYCDYYGIGASPLGDGTGIARIGTGLTDGAVALTTTHKGMYFNNIQFIGAGGVDAFLATALLRSTFENCVFGDNAAGTSAVNAGFNASATVAGCVFRNCFLGMANTATKPVYGLYGGAQFSQNLIENCVICGTTAGIYIHTGQNAFFTIIRNNVIGDAGGGCAKGIDDNSNGCLIIANNEITATDAIESTARGTINLIRNYVVDGTTPLAEPMHDDAV